MCDLFDRLNSVELSTFDPELGQSTSAKWSAEHGWRLAHALSRLPDARTADAAKSFAALTELHRRVEDAVVTPASAPATSTTNDAPHRQPTQSADRSLHYRRETRVTFRIS